MFMLGADTDTKESLRETVKFAMKNHIDTIQLAALTPLPGTPLFDELNAAGCIFEKNWYLYDAQHVVFEPANMTAYELQLEALRGYMKFYSKRQWAKYFFTFRFTKLLFQTWGRHIIRTWRRDKRNKAFMKTLKQLPWPHPTRLVQGNVKRVSTE